MRTFGLTGGIGTGKSTVAQMLRTRHGIPVVDADQVARSVVAPGSEGLEALVARFGADILDETGALDRTRMRSRVMADPEARHALEAVTHPRIFQGIRDRLDALSAAGHARAVVEAALMVETGSWRLYDGLIVVSAAPETQIERVVARDDSTPAQAQAVLAAQLPLADKEAVATWVVHNDADLASLEAEVDRLAAVLT